MGSWILKNEQKQKVLSDLLLLLSTLKQAIETKIPLVPSSVRAIKSRKVTLYLLLFSPENPLVTDVLPYTQREGTSHRETQKNWNKQALVSSLEFITIRSHPFVLHSYFLLSVKIVFPGSLSFY